MNKVVLLLGSNLGNKMKNISTALLLINERIGNIKKKSEVIETAPVGYESSQNYLNVGIIVETSLSPIQLLKKIKKIERDLGRLKDSSESGIYEDRTMDIDIVNYNKLRYKSKNLIIPHIGHTLKRSFSKKILDKLT